MNILFDLDGTLVDPRIGIVASLRLAVEHMGCEAPPDAELESYIGPPLKESLRTLLKTSDEGALTMATEVYRQHYSTVGLYQTSTYKGIPETLRTLRSRGLKLGIATSKPRVFAERVLEHVEFESYFQYVYGSELDGARAEKSELLQHLLYSESLDAAQTILVGDRRHDVEAAISSGVLPVGVLWGFGTRRELMAAGATLLCETPPDLLRIRLSGSIRGTT